MVNEDSNEATLIFKAIGKLTEELEDLKTKVNELWINRKEKR